MQVRYQHAAEMRADLKRFSSQSSNPGRLESVHRHRSETRRGDGQEAALVGLGFAVRSR